MSGASGGAVPLTLAGLAWGVGISCLSIVASLTLGLHLEAKFIIATVRMVLQLTILGYILKPIFSNPRAVVTVLIILIMITVAAREAHARSKYHYSGQFRDTWLSIGGANIAVMAMAMALIIPSAHWYSPQVIIPLTGMMLNNCLTAVSAGISGFLIELGERRHAVEDALARGATTWEAVVPLVRCSMRSGLLPTLNTMNVLGIVSIPGLMTGQILSGYPPDQAARYQILIYFLICTCSSFGTLSAIIFACRGLFDSSHRLRSRERLTRREEKADDLITSFFRHVSEQLGKLRRAGSRRDGELEPLVVTTK